MLHEKWAPFVSFIIFIPNRERERGRKVKERERMGVKKKGETKKNGGGEKKGKRQKRIVKNTG